MRAALFTSLLLAGCYLSHGIEAEPRPDSGPRPDVPGFDVPRPDVPPDVPRPDVPPDVPSPPVDPVCCAAACGAGELCGLDICSQVTRMVCAPPGAGCSLEFVDCDEGSDCVGTDVCRSDETGRFRCQPPSPDCIGDVGPGCDYACSTDGDCPPGAPFCQSVFAEGLAGCPSVGFCTQFRR